MYRHILFLLIIIATVSCGKRGGRANDDLLPKARGEPDEIILVIDSTQWADTLGLGREIRKSLLTPMLGLPQDEPLFNVSKVSPQKLNTVLKSSINMLFVTTLDSKTADSRAIQNYFTSQSLNRIRRDTNRFMRIQRDEFAKGQSVMFLFSAHQDILIRKIKTHRTQIVTFFEESARRSIQDKLFKKRVKDMEKILTAKHGVALKIPFGWQKAKDLKNFVWYRNLDDDSEQSVFIYYEPYQDDNIFNDIGKFRDKITATFLRDSEKPSLFIQRQEIINIFTKRVNFNGKFALEARSLWKISDNSRGGPFMSYTIVDEWNGMVYYIEGYVDSPGTRKKNLIRELEAIIATFRTPNDLHETSVQN